jgi:hypothetical protein
VVNGVTQAKVLYQPIVLTAAQLAQTTFQTGTGPDDLYVAAFDGTAWSAGKEFHVSPPAAGGPATVASGATLELTSAYSGTVTFAGPTGVLKLDQSASFTGKIGGQLAIGDVIDLTDITAGASATIGYTGNNSPGTLTVGDGTRTAHIALLGNYSPASFTASSDGHGGTSVVDPPLSGPAPMHGAASVSLTPVAPHADPEAAAASGAARTEYATVASVAATSIEPRAQDATSAVSAPVVLPASPDNAWALGSPGASTESSRQDRHARGHGRAALAVAVR